MCWPREWRSDQWRQYVFSFVVCKYFLQLAISIHFGSFNYFIWKQEKWGKAEKLCRTMEDEQEQEGRRWIKRSRPRQKDDGSGSAGGWNNDDTILFTTTRRWLASHIHVGPSKLWIYIVLEKTLLYSLIRLCALQWACWCLSNVREDWTHL